MIIQKWLVISAKTKIQLNELTVVSLYIFEMVGQDKHFILFLS